MSNEEKRRVLIRIAQGSAITPAGRSKYRVKDKAIHVRFCSTNIQAPSKYKFNINPNTLSADYELWICGSADTSYLIPIDFIKKIYDNPRTYEDYGHPGIKMVSVDTDSHLVTYASGAQKESLHIYLGAVV